MPATIRFNDNLRDGLEATLLDGEGTWTCDDPVQEELLKVISEGILLEEIFHPDWVNGLAKAVAEKVSATVIRKHPFNWKLPPGAVG
jgi:hypothetical protein